MVFIFLHSIVFLILVIIVAISGTVYNIPWLFHPEPIAHIRADLPLVLELPNETILLLLALLHAHIISIQLIIINAFITSIFDTVHTLQA